MSPSPLLLALVILASPVSLEAAKGKAKPKPAATQGIHKVKKGETASKIARANQISLQALQELNPGLDLGKLSVGTPVRIAAVKGAAAPTEAGALAAAPVPTAPAPVPVAPLPATPSAGPANLVHLEKVIPAVPLKPTPGIGASSEAKAPGAPTVASLMQPVMPRATLAEAPILASLELSPLDPGHLDLLWPVETRSVSSAWGPRMRTRTVKVKTQANTRKKVRVRYRGNHRGIDLTAPTGTDVYAALDGVVVDAGRHRQYGNFVTVDHGSGVVTLYAHNHRNFVREGEVVRRGQKIAEVGRTGNATGPHLHFELRVEGVHHNPLPWLNDVEEIPAELVALNEIALPQGPARR